MKHFAALVLSIAVLGCSATPVAERTMPTGSIRSARMNEQSFSVGELPAERLVEYTAFLRMKTETPDSLFRRVLVLTTNAQGYMLHSDNSSLTVRIPSEQFSTFLASVSGLGEVASQEVQGLDVTEEYYDLQTRLDNAQKTRQRYLDLLNRAQTVEQALGVERELERINRDIDLLTGRLNKHKHLATFATVTVTTLQPVQPGPVGYVFYGLYRAVRWLFIWD